MVPQRGQTATASANYLRYFTLTGEVRTRCVALVTRDPALYADLAGVLRERRLPTVSLLPGERIPDRVAVVLTTPAEATKIQHPHVLEVPANPHRESLLAAVAAALLPVDNASELVVGIDPGPRPGYALISGSTCLIQGSLDGPEEVATLGRRLKRWFPDRPLRFRVGSGDRISNARIVNALWELRRPIELVDERGTTIRGHRRPRDPEAARQIASVRGRPIEGPSPIRITDGDVANVQRLSRESSGGDSPPPRPPPSRVLEGALTLNQAVEEGRRRYQRPDSEARRGHGQVYPPPPG
jgi:hypothetical protein